MVLRKSTGIPRLSAHVETTTVTANSRVSHVVEPVSVEVRSMVFGGVQSCSGMAVRLFELRAGVLAVKGILSLRRRRAVGRVFVIHVEVVVVHDASRSSTLRKISSGRERAPGENLTVKMVRHT